MTAATNETCLGYLDENYNLIDKGMTFFIAQDVNLLWRIFLVGKMSNFLAVGWVSLNYLGEKFWEIILLNSALNSSKFIMVMLLKMLAVGKTFGKICLKALSLNTFFPIYGLWSREGHGHSVFWWSWYSTEGKIQIFGLSGRLPSNSLS